jgi:EmrB/QacA subfamily drug resistance transporter
MQVDKKYLLTMLIVILAAFLFQLDTSIVNISLPAIAGFYKVSTSEISYVIAAYLLIVNSTMLLFGKLSDRKGTKPVFVAGSGLFIVGSLLCGFSLNHYMLIGARCIQGLGGSIILTSAYTIISRFIPADMRGKAFGVLGTASALGLTLGAPMGGLITGFFSWQWIFLVQVPVAAFALILAAHVLPAKKDEKEQLKGLNQFDLPGAVLSFSGLLALVFCLSMWQELGPGSPAIIAGFIASPVLMLIFIVWESRHPDPILHLKIFSSRVFSLNLTSRFLCAIHQGGNFFLMPFYLISLKGLHTGYASLIIAIYSAVFTLVSPIGGILAGKYKSSALCAVSMALAIVSTAGFMMTLHLNGLIHVVIFLSLIAASFAIYYPPNNRLSLDSAPQDSKGVASGVISTIWTLGLLLGVSLFESVFNMCIPHNTVNALTAGSISPEALARGFRYAYSIGALSCLGAAACSMAIVVGQRGESSQQEAQALPATESQISTG